MGEGASLALVGPMGWCTPSFAIGLVKMVSGFIVRSVESGLGRWMLVVAVISVDCTGCTVLPDSKKTELGSSNQEALLQVKIPG